MTTNGGDPTSSGTSGTASTCVVAASADVVSDVTSVGASQQQPRRTSSSSSTSASSTSTSSAQRERRRRSGRRRSSASSLSDVGYGVDDGASSSSSSATTAASKSSACLEKFLKLRKDARERRLRRERKLVLGLFLYTIVVALYVVALRMEFVRIDGVYQRAVARVVRSVVPAMGTSAAPSATRIAAQISSEEWPILESYDSQHQLQPQRRRQQQQQQKPQQDYRSVILRNYLRGGNGSASILYLRKNLKLVRTASEAVARSTVSYLRRGLFSSSGQMQHQQQQQSEEQPFDQLH